MDTSDVVLRNIIFHWLFPLDPKARVTLSEQEVPLDRDPTLTEYFTQYIVSGLQDGVRWAARFSNPPGLVYDQCLKIAADPSANLVASSKTLAERLRQLVVANTRISRGNLAVCLYTVGPSVSPYIALLKFDPSPALRPVEVVKEGPPYVTFRVEADMLPTPQVRLQKGAFIGPFPLDPSTYQMMVIDRQSKDAEEQVARFFRVGFLGAEEASTPRQRTERFYDAVIDVRNEIERSSPVDAEALIQALQVEITRESIDLDDWLGRSGFSRQVIDQLNAQFGRQKLTERQFVFDPDYARELIQKRIFRGSYGLRIEVESEYYSEVIQPYDSNYRPPNDGRKRFIVTTEEWVEVKKAVRTRSE